MSTKKLILGGIVAGLVVAGCAGQKTSGEKNAASKSSNPDVHVVKSKDGSFDGEIIGTPKAEGKFAKLQIGMVMKEVTGLIGAPDNLTEHETGKRWIPFYFGPDVKRIEVLYKGEGCLTYTGGNQFGGGGGTLIRIAVDANGACMEG